MSDPLDVLRSPVTPADPDPAFAERLRERLRRAVLQPGRAAMTSPRTSLPHVEGDATAWGPTLQPHLGVSDARRALDWYAEVFDAERRDEPTVMPDGSIGHAELGIGDAVLMLAEYGPGPAGPGQSPTGPAHSLFVSVPDADETIRRAVAAGALLERPAADYPYGRMGVIVDPFGHRWMVNTRPRWATRARSGDMVYATLFVREEGRLREFYGQVLGARVLEHETSPTVSIWGIHREPSPGDQAPGLVPVYRVPDVDAALDRVREAGGSADEPEDRGYGRIASAVDPEGNRFSVWQPPGA
jgi:uncharacterized glyoxalase superfamily protein PhnB